MPLIIRHYIFYNFNQISLIINTTFKNLYNYLSMVKFLNLFSQVPTLRINGQMRPSSIFGSIVGFFSLCSLFAGLSFILINYFSRLEYIINSYTDNSAKPDIDLKNFKFGLIITDLMGKEFPDQDRLIKISAMYWDIYLPVFGENRTQEVTLTNIPIIKCNEYKNDTLHKKDFDQYSKMYNINCLDIPSLNKTLKGIYSNLGR